MGKRIFKIGSVDPEITPYNVTNSQILPLYNITTYMHTITPVFPGGLGRGVLMYTHSSPVRFRSHVIGGEPIAINRGTNPNSDLLLSIS